MTQKNKRFLLLSIFSGLIGTLVLLGDPSNASAHTIEMADERAVLAEIGLPRGSLNLVRLVPVTNEGETVGMVAVYDDPVTLRSEDYLELHDGDGEIVAIGWFDQFGIRRITVDRALVEGQEKFQRVFVTLVSGESI